MATIPPTTGDNGQARTAQNPVARATISADSPKRSDTPSSLGCEYRDDNHNFIDESIAIFIHAALSTLLNSEKFSDMTIICGDRQFKAHRAVESNSRSIELPKDDPDVLERFLEFLYTGTYSDGVNSTWGKPSNEAFLDPETVLQSLRQPACGNQEAKEPDEEPDEEYNEYDDRPRTPSDNGDVRGDEKSEPAKVAEAVAFGRCSREEGLKQLASLRNDMTLSLRLYVMADKISFIHILPTSKLGFIVNGNMTASRFETESFTGEQFVESAGTVLFRVSTNEICILRHVQRNEYLLPKGRRNLHESREATAIRETTEETGISCHLMPLDMFSRVCPSDAGSEHVPDEARFFRGACEPILVQARRVGQGEMKIIWWFVAAVDEEKPAGRHEDKFDVEFLSYEAALERLTFKNDRDLVGKAIKLVKSTFAS
ncbi:hypothetical protein FLONG3_9697 [Fusarium longipes]|uniref:Nudix hydrolase domain-containing protein n=1 Tax=Fusarium longipes TaxID=694270 RepID=A0A395RV12_9HYPO|nr:hypothetical protein FLONG3_9697 [Fusarium longipes]